MPGGVGVGSLRFLTAGESHGPQLTVLVEGIPAGLSLEAEYINGWLFRRQQGYGRGGRMTIERDRAEIVAGVRGGITLGSPVALVIRNRDWENWREVMAPGPEARLQDRVVTRPRPGHADLAGAMKYRHTDLRNVLERASARETAARVAAGAVAARLLEAAGVALAGHVVQIGPVRAEVGLNPDVLGRARSSPVFCADPQAETNMMAAIDRAREEGDTLGGVFEVVAWGIPPGLGSYAHWDRRLDGRLAQALMSIPGIRGVEIGLGFAAASRPGSEVHDPIFWEPGRGFSRGSNHAGGLEGGVTNGEPLVLRAAMKPIPTLARPLASVDLRDRKPVSAAYERSDVCAVPAASVVGEAMAALVLADALLEKVGGDHLEELKLNLENYRRYLAAFGGVERDSRG
ncbi:MAG: chorismate synthase [Clostridia bacterium]|nr:chorismate synthase [Clostridia bacterium]